MLLKLSLVPFFPSKLPLILPLCCRFLPPPFSTVPDLCQCWVHLIKTWQSCWFSTRSRGWQKWAVSNPTLCSLPVGKRELQRNLGDNDRCSEHIQGSTACKTSSSPSLLRLSNKKRIGFKQRPALKMGKVLQVAGKPSRLQSLGMWLY